MNFHHIPVGPNPPEIVNAVIEVPQGCSLKYEYDEQYDIIKLDRVLHSPLFYPCDYGFIPQTRSDDGDHLDVLILVTAPSFPGCVMEVRPVGMLKMTDDQGKDFKILAVPRRDPRFEEVRRLEDLGDHFPKEISHFFEVYKYLEEKMVDVHGWENVEAAHAEVLKTMDVYKREQGPPKA